MADQTQRLEIATVRAEVGSNIVFRFANDAANADSIPTQSGDIQNLKQVVLEIQQDAAEKISISTTIYPTVAQGLAATADQGIFLVQSNEADEIYTVWQNQGGTAVNTGKTALSATAIQSALDASSEAAQAAENAADIATNRTAGFLAPSANAPELRENGLPLQAGDRYFNTEEQSEYIYKDSGWAANDSLEAISELNSQISQESRSNGIPRANDDGKIDQSWLPGAPMRSISLRAFGGVMDGITNDYAALSAALDAGSIPVFDGPCLISPSNAEESAKALSSIDSWQLQANAELSLPARNDIELDRLLDLKNSTLGRLLVTGKYLSSGRALSLASNGGGSTAWNFDVALASAAEVTVGDTLLMKPTTGWTDWDAFVAGSWQVTAVNGNTVSFTTSNAYPSLPASPISTGALDVYVLRTVVRFPRNSIGLRLNGAILGGLKNIAFRGRFDIASESAFDGKGDGLQVGGAADTYNTGLNESEQIQQGAIWCQRVAFNQFQGNGIQNFHGSLAGSLIFTSGNAWRGEQSAGCAESLIKSSVSSGNGASGYETEAVGDTDFADSWAIGNQQQGVVAIGLSQLGGLRFVSMFNLAAQADARNGGHIIADGATIIGTDAVLCNGGRILAGAGAVISGRIKVDEAGVLITKGATSVSGTPTIEEGSIYQLIDGSIYKNSPELNRLLYNASWQFRAQMSSIGDVSFQFAPAGSSAWTTNFVMKNGSDFYPSLSSQNLGRTTNPWSLIYSKNIVLTPPSNATPANNGEVMLQLTSNNSLTFKVKGADGVVRSGSIALA